MRDTSVGRLEQRSVIGFLVLLLVVGLGITAGTFQTGTFTTGESNAPMDVAPADSESRSPPPVLLGVYVFVGLALVLGSAGFAAGYLYGDTSPARMAAFGFGLAVLGTAFLLAVDVDIAMGGAPSPGDAPDFQSVADVFRDGNGSAAQPRGGDSAPTDIDGLPPVVVLAVLGGLLLVGLVGIGRFSTGAPVRSAPSPAGSADGADGVETEIGGAAGRAAARIGETDLSNVVYRAWREMTAALDVPHGETMTPAEFADAAVAAGLDEADVEQLTQLFRDVRYGHAPVTPERADQAEATLRRIQETYGNGEADAR